MKILLWVFQIFLAIHTAIGAVWKFTNTAEQAAPSLAAIPPTAWMSLSVIELICAAFLLIPIVKKNLMGLASIGAAVIAIEMLGFCALHMMSGDPNKGPMIYWLVVAALSLFIAYSRRVRKA